MKIEELPEIDLFSAAYRADPESVLGPARDTDGAACSARGVEMLTYANASELLKDEGFGQGRDRLLAEAGLSKGDPVYDTLTQLLINLEGDVHKRQRRSVNRWFTPRKAETWREDVRQWINGWIDEYSVDGEIDMFAAVARPLPAALVCRIIGAPMEHTERIAGWSDDVLSIVDPSPESMARLTNARSEIDDFISELVADKRKKPGDDLLSALIEAEAEGDISAADMTDVVLSIITGSTDTTTTQICLNIETLQGRPQDRQRLRDAPGLLPNAVLELMRFSPGMLSTPRMTLDMSGTQRLPGLDDIDPSLLYHVNIESANMDPAVYDDPTVFDLTRNMRGCLPLNFGGGRHGCLGRVLSLIEQEEVLRACLTRWSEYEVVESDYSGAPTMHFAHSSKLRFEPAL